MYSAAGILCELIGPGPGPLMEVHEKGWSQFVSSYWALLAGSIGSIFQIDEERSKKGTSKYLNLVGCM